MKKIVLALLLFSSIVTIGYAQIMTTETQGLKRSSLIKVEKVKKPLKIYNRQNFLIGGLSFHPSQLSVYSMVGTVKRYGLYGKLKTDFNFNSNCDYSTNSEYDNYFMKDAKNGRYSFTGGMLFRLNNPLSIYTGFGYGRRWLNWISTSGNTCNLSNYSYKGLEMESGVLYKLKELYLNIGLQTNSFTYLEMDFGVGINF
jgi:opacity protein-like surface antigen